MTRLQTFRQLRAAMAAPERIGDIPVLKSELSGFRVSPQLEAILEGVRNYRPKLNLNALAAQAPGTFGHEYSRFLQENGLSPLVPTDNLSPELMARNTFVLRYGITHDMVHVLTGFDTQWPGEIGVYAFAAAQPYSTMFLRMVAWFALAIAVLRCPLKLREAWRCFRRGRRMGRKAKLLIGVRLEEFLHENLKELRTELGLQGAGAGYLPSSAGGS